MKTASKIIELPKTEDDEPQHSVDWIEITIKEALPRLGFSLDDQLRYRKKDQFGNPVDHIDKFVALKVYLYLKDKYDKTPSKGVFLEILQSHREDTRKDQFAEHRQNIKFDSSCRNKISELMEAICGHGHNPLYSVIMNQVGYCIKLRMNDRVPDYPLFLNFSGPANIGKSYFAKLWMESVVPSRYVMSVGNTIDGSILSNNERSGHLFTGYFALLLNELEGGNKTALESLKNRIDSPEINYRAFGQNISSTRGVNRAQLIGTSNKHLRETFPEDKPENIRKYCDIPFAAASSEADLKERQAVINSFNFLEWIRSINENSPSPLSSRYPEFLAWVKSEFVVYSDTDLWLLAYAHKHNGKKASYFGDIFTRYQKCKDVGNRVKSKNIFRTSLLKNGFKKNPKTQYGFSYAIPLVTTLLPDAEEFLNEV